MARTSFPPSLCLNHKCLPPDNFSAANFVFLQRLLALSRSVCTAVAGRNGEEGKLLVLNICTEQPSGWASPPSGGWFWTLSPDPHEIYPRLNCLSHY